MIPVSKPSLPSRKAVDRYLDGIYERGRVTNHGPLVEELTARLRDYLGVEHLLLVANGTVALQVAYRALEITGSSGRAVTTPFTFVATESSLSWERLAHRFADILPGSLNLDPARAGALVDEDLTLIVPVHVYGTPCAVDAFAELAERAGARTVYDAAHAFGVMVEGRSVLAHGDASTLSFHATKPFHTIEGGAIVFRDADARERAAEIINFGMRPGTARVNRVGINAKLSEMHAAFGLALLDEIDGLLEHRRQNYAAYVDYLPDALNFPAGRPDAVQTVGYMPVLFGSAGERSRCEQALQARGIASRRYFSLCPGSIGELEQLPVAADAAERILCLPMYAELREAEIKIIGAAVEEALA